MLTGAPLWGRQIEGSAMSKVRGAVYPPPTKDLPPVAVILFENEVVGARAVPSVEAGEAFLANMIKEFSGMVGHKGDRPKKSS
jgi:hypothetical protein